MTKEDMMQSDSPSGLVMQPKAVTSPHKCRKPKEERKMKYVLIDWVRDGDMFTEEFETAEKAVESASYEWEHLSESDKNRRSDFYVLESANPDEDAEDHFDGNIVKRWK